MGMTTGESTTGHFNEQLAYDVAKRLYFKGGEDSLDDVFRRVAVFVGGREGNGEESDLARQSFDVMSNREFIPNSPCLMNAGADSAQMSACFVLPMKDDLGEIMTVVHESAMILKSGGGCGYNFSRLRPSGDMVQSTKGTASGPLSFVRILNSVSTELKQGLKRHGASMAVLNCDHPDIVKFIQSKDDGGLQAYNISVGITDEFMDAVENDSDVDLINPRDGSVWKTLPAAKLFRLIAESAWKTGDPGVLFLDNINNRNHIRSQSTIDATNPCGEQPLLPYESCNLGSIDVSKFVVNRRFDWEGLSRVIGVAVRFLDRVIDVQDYPTESVKSATLYTRKIGLGVMGFADALIRLGIRYGSKASIECAEELMSFISMEARLESQRRSKESGPCTAMKCCPEAVDRLGGTFRNLSITTIAPTGSISILAGCSSGIEPNFAREFTRVVHDKKEVIRHPLADSEYFVSAHDLGWEEHVAMQAAFQRHCDSGVSKTVNMKNSATVDDVADAYLEAWRLGCSGITVFRDGCRDDQVLEADYDESKNPDIRIGFTEKREVGCGSIYVTLNRGLNNELLETFTASDGTGGCPSQSEAIGRLVSMAMQRGVDPSIIADQLCSIKCISAAASRHKNGHITSCPGAIGKVILRALESNSEMVDNVTGVEVPAEVRICPICNYSLEEEFGCIVCSNCGYRSCRG